MSQLIGARVLLTGASRGLGRALAVRLGELGCRVVLVARDVPGLEDAAQAMRAAGGEAIVLPCDLADAAGWEPLARAAEAAFDGLDVVIHNAGVEPFAPFDQAEVERLDLALQVNLRAPIVLTRHLVGAMKARGAGHFVFLGSTSGLFLAPYAAVYGATKAAIANFSLSLASELGPAGLRFSVVQPGFIVGTGMFEDRRGPLDPPAFTGSTTAEAVVDAVVDAILHDRPSVVVNSVPMGLSTAIGRLFPRLGLWLSHRAVRPFMARLAGNTTK